MEEQICKKCKKRPINSRRSKIMCGVCVEKMRIWKRNASNAALSNGLCSRCRKNPRCGQYTLCESCRKGERIRLLKYKAENKKALQEKNKIYRAANKDKERARIKNWENRNPDKVIASRKRRHYTRDMLEKFAVGFFTAKDWEEILEKYGRKCLWCGSFKRITIDHIIPLKRGGSNFPSNLQPLCVSCNSKKKTKIIDFRPFGSSILDWT